MVKLLPNLLWDYYVSNQSHIVYAARRLVKIATFVCSRPYSSNYSLLSTKATGVESFDSVALAETTYLNTVMCKFESSQIEESGA